MKTYSHGAVISIIINYAIGTGILNLPHTIAACSIGTSVIFMAIISITSYLIGQFTLDALSQSFALTRSSDSLLENSMEPGFQRIQEVSFSLPNDKTYHMSTLCKMYFGKKGFYTYQVGIIVYFFGTIWGYANVVASSLTSVIPFKSLPHFTGDSWDCSDPTTYQSACIDSYWIWVCIILVFCAVLVQLNLAEQKVLQSIFTFCRFLLLLITGILTIYCISTQPFLPADQYKESNFINPNLNYFSFNAKNFGSLFSAMTFSMVYHHSLPGIFQPVAIEHQRNLNWAIILSHVFLFIITFVLTLPAALYFGTNGIDLVTLNFTNWNGNGFNTDDVQPAFTIAISFIIRLLPPIYVLTAIPINGLTLSYNILEMFTENTKNKKWVVVLINLVSVIPAILLGGFVRTLGIIISFTGLAGYIIMLAPACILLKAKEQCKKNYPNAKPTFEIPLSKKWIMWFTIVFNIVGFGFTIYTLIMSAIGK